MTLEPESRFRVKVVEPTEKDATELPLAMMTERLGPVSSTLKSELNWKSVPEATTRWVLSIARTKPRYIMGFFISFA